jgi:hypothetical protein
LVLLGKLTSFDFACEIAFFCSRKLKLRCNTGKAENSFESDDESSNKMKSIREIIDLQLRKTAYLSHFRS